MSAQVRPCPQNQWPSFSIESWITSTMACMYQDLSLGPARLALSSQFYAHNTRRRCAANSEMTCVTRKTAKGLSCSRS